MTPSLLVRRLAQLALLTLMMGPVAALSSWPPYRRIPDDAAVIKLSFTHRADRAAECRRLSPAELARLPPNMRRPTECPRGRRDIHAELWIDGARVFAGALPPTGLSRDGPSHVYRRFVVPAGAHVVVARLRDTPRAEGFDYERTEQVSLEPGQSLALDFRPGLGGFVIR
jgi:hypothetical protein